MSTEIRFGCFSKNEYSELFTRYDAPRFFVSDVAKKLATATSASELKDIMRKAIDWDDFTMDGYYDSRINAGIDKALTAFDGKQLTEIGSIRIYVKLDESEMDYIYCLEASYSDGAPRAAFGEWDADLKVKRIHRVELGGGEVLIESPAKTCSGFSALLDWKNIEKGGGKNATVKVIE